MDGMMLALLLGVLAVNCDCSSLEEIRAAVILPESTEFEAAIPKVLPALTLAAKRVTPLLPGKRLVFYPADDKCDSHHALKNAVSAKMCPDDSQRIHVFFGPNCEYCVASVSRLLKYWSTPLLTTGALTFDFTKDKRAPDSEFHLLVRMGHISFASIAHFIIALLNKYKWTKVALVYQRNGCTSISGKFTSKLMMETLVEFLKRQAINYTAYDLEKNNMSLAENLKREVGNDYASKCSACCVTNLPSHDSIHV